MASSKTMEQRHERPGEDSSGEGGGSGVGKPGQGGGSGGSKPGAPGSGWNLVGYGKECNFGAGEKYLRDSPGMQAGTLTQCLKSCKQSGSSCKSITLYGDGYCSHFSTRCTSTKKLSKAASFRMGRSRSSL